MPIWKLHLTLALWSKVQLRIIFHRSSDTSNSSINAVVIIIDKKLFHIDGTWDEIKERN